MAAHLRSIVSTCSEHGCTSQAKEQLYNTRNAPMGTYCKRHAKEALKRQLDLERRHGLV